MVCNAMHAVVSIHASTREATSDEGFDQVLSEVSIHASTREATCLKCKLGNPWFQSRLHEGSDIA